VPLSKDQKAMLRLLAQREEGYEDIAALLDLSVQEVRSRVKEALSQLDENGQPSQPTESPARGRSEPAPRPRPARPKADTPPRIRTPLPRIAMPKDRRAIGAIAAGAALVVVLVLLLTGVFGGGSSSSGKSAPSNKAAAKGSPGLTQAVLSPVGGGSAKGRAIFGRVRNTPVLGFEAQGLEPSPPGRTYTVWLYHSPKVVLRVGAVKVGKSGGIGAQFPFPTELLGYVASGAFDEIDVSLTDDAAYKAEVAKAKREKRLPAYTGEDVLRGPITGPIVKK
jgi:hypothetical protein